MKMKSFFPKIYLIVLALMMILYYFLRSPDNIFFAQLQMESDAMTIVNYYIPRQIKLEDHPREPLLKLPEFKSNHPRYGTLILGNGNDSLFTIILDESKQEGFSYLYIDKNNNEDLTDDGEPFWDEDKITYWTKDVLLDVRYENNPQAAVPYQVSFYRYKNRLDDVIVAYRNCYRKGQIALKDTTYKIAILDDDLDGFFHDINQGAIIIDVNHDGVLDGNTDSPELLEFAQPDQAFNVQGYSYKIKYVSPSGDKITLALADTLVPPKEVLSTGIPAPDFTSTAINGQIVELTAWQGKVILVDFWATWCKPWEKELRNLKNVYFRYHRQGFEIIGVSLDYDLDTLQEYIKKNQIPWPQIADGQGWSMPLVQLYRVHALPKNFLIDRNGIIRYKDVFGRNLSTKVRELIHEPF